MAQTYSPQTQNAVTLLGLEIARVRRARRWTVAELAERVGVSHVTVRAAERGAPSVTIGTVFEIATVLGIDLLAPAAELGSRLERSRERLALLPARVRATTDDIDDDF